MKKIYICYNRKSNRIANTLKKKLIRKGFIVTNSLDKDVDLVITCGGDGTFLSKLRTLNFPDVLFAGINTGHLGFFQEISTKNIDEFIDKLITKDYQIHKINPLKFTINQNNHHIYNAVNEVVFKNVMGKTMHAGIYISDDFVEKFSGDGIIVSSTSGSTAYNYSAGGAVIDPRVELLQITPISPLNSNAYRCITSGIILPQSSTIKILSEGRNRNGLEIFADGYRININKICQIDISYDMNKTIKLIKFGNYKFWKKIKEKFL